MSSISLFSDEEVELGESINVSTPKSLKNGKNKFFFVSICVLSNKISLSYHF